VNLIQEELKKAEEKKLKLIPGAELVELSSENVAIVEAMIQNDSAYLKSSDINAGPKYKKTTGEESFGGSTAYWMVRLKEALTGGKVITDGEYENIVNHAVAAVDRENSTHLNSDGVGRRQMAERILQLGKDDLLKLLRDPDGTGLELIHFLSKETKPEEKKYSPRRNVSFASKFCHYACFYIFEGTEYQDNYSILDNVLLNVIPRYAKFYGISFKKNELNDYAMYRKIVDEIIKKAGACISRNGFDQLLWYYFKGRIEID